MRFTIEYGCPDLNLTREPAVLKVEGECRYDTATKMFDQFVLRDEELRFHMPDGTQTRRHYIMVAEGIFLGHKNIEKIVRVELE